MKEDTTHMKGPVEMLKEDLLNLLPNYMVPNKIILMDRLPLTSNGKIDHKTLADSKEVNTQSANKPFIAPRTQDEEQIAEIWKQTMKWDAVSVQDDFFESGGNSLMAVSMINKINKKFNATLPLQILFEAPTIEKLARKLSITHLDPISRFIPLSKSGNKAPIYCWPGLGGYPMNLRLLAEKSAQDRPFYGVQAQGINSGETPYPTIKVMAATDIKMLKSIQPKGPYTLWGYSFGARVAFEVAYQLEKAGDIVENLFLIAPGSPTLQTQTESRSHNRPTFDNEAFVTILFSVFAHNINSPALKECLKVSKDEQSFAHFICSRYRHLDINLVTRITEIVRQTYEFEYNFRELNDRKINANISIFKAQGDDYSFLENRHQFTAQPPSIINLQSDHYQLLQPSGVNELVAEIQSLKAKQLHATEPFPLLKEAV